MKKVFKLLMVAVMVVILTGCGKTEKKAMTAADFLKKYEEKYKNYIYDNSKLFDYANGAYQIKNDNIDVSFIDGKKMFDIEGTYLDEVKNLYSLAGQADDNYSKKVRKGKNWSSVTVKDGAHYYRITLVDKTYLMGKGLIDQQATIDKIFEECGY